MTILNLINYYLIRLQIQLLPEYQLFEFEIGR